MTPQHVLLVPGFFGFSNVGDFTYFGHVRDFLVEEWRRRGLAGEIRVVKTWPTASVRRRAVRVLETLAQVLDAEDGVVHLVGHSSGGIDVRLALTPGVQLDCPLPVEPYASRVRTAISLASPHHGTPLAGFLTSVYGREILRVVSLSAMYTLRTGRVPIGAVFQVVRLLSINQLPIAAGTLLSNIYRDLLKDFSEDRRRAIELLLGEIGQDQSLLAETSPQGMALIAPSLQPRRGVRYGSVVGCAPPPGLRSAFTTGLSPFRQATYALYAAFYRIIAQMPADKVPEPTHGQAAVLRAAYGHVPGPSENDGMVPTRSQLDGEVVHAAWADHLDVLGHFYAPAHVPPHFDWLNSATRFGRGDFLRAWRDCTRFMLD